MRNIAVFDFDGTLYEGDTTIDFAFFIYKKIPIRFPIFFIQLLALPLYLLKIINTKQYKNIYILYLKNINPEKLNVLIKEFWNTKYPKHFKHEIIKHYLLNKQNGITNICISASPDILIKPLLIDTLKFDYVIATTVIYNKNKYIIKGENCRGAEKINRLNNLFENEPYYIENAFSDNKDDKKLLKIALKGYFIHNNQITNISDEQKY